MDAVFGIGAIKYIVITLHIASLTVISRMNLKVTVARLESLKSKETADLYFSFVPHIISVVQVLDSFFRFCFPIVTFTGSGMVIMKKVRAKNTLRYR